VQKTEIPVSSSSQISEQKAKGKESSEQTCYTDFRLLFWQYSQSEGNNRQQDGT
jgi:hypothetical protein